VPVMLSAGERKALKKRTRGARRPTGTGCGRRSCWLRPAAGPAPVSPRTCTSVWTRSASGGAGSPPAGWTGLRTCPGPGGRGGSARWNGLRSARWPASCPPPQGCPCCAGPLRNLPPNWRPSARIGFIRALTAYTVLRRAPGWDGCGVRVRTIPESFATSIAATRSWTARVVRHRLPAVCSPRHLLGLACGITASCRGSRSAGTRPGILTGVLEATICDPQVKDPSARLTAGFAFQVVLASRAARSTVSSRTAAHTPPGRGSGPGPEITHPRRTAPSPYWPRRWHPPRVQLLRECRGR
jgi:hypothetical protein